MFFFYGAFRLVGFRQGSTSKFVDYDALTEGLYN